MTHLTKDGRAHKRDPFARRGLAATRAWQVSCGIRDMSRVLCDRLAVTWLLPQNIHWHLGNGNLPYNPQQIGGWVPELGQRQ